MQNCYRNKKNDFNLTDYVSSPKKRKTSVLRHAKISVEGNIGFTEQSKSLKLNSTIKLKLNNEDFTKFTDFAIEKRKSLELLKC